MADIQIERQHDLGLSEARKIALTWAAKAEARYALTCRYEQGQHGDQLSFSRPGVKGRLTVTPENFEFQARLGLLFSAFKEKIEDKLRTSLDKAIVPSAAGASPQA
jgi:putative polyhydroxyalkanoate system protein